VNEVRQILADYLQRPSMTQNEAIRWMCISTKGAADQLYREVCNRKQNVSRLTDESLDINMLWADVKTEREAMEESKKH
jgi:hypothetical protein